MADVELISRNALEYNTDKKTSTTSSSARATTLGLLGSYDGSRRQATPRERDDQIEGMYRRQQQQMGQNATLQYRRLIDQMARLQEEMEELRRENAQMREDRHGNEEPAAAAAEPEPHYEQLAIEAPPEDYQRPAEQQTTAEQKRRGRKRGENPSKGALRKRDEYERKRGRRTD